MSTPRQIKASEVRKGMRVEYVRNEFGVETVVRGLASRDAESSRLTTVIYLGVSAQQFIVQPETEVTVLADPEPEWVEGAWYQIDVNGNETIARRIKGGWVRWDRPVVPSWEDCDPSRRITVLSRVLIVDWPGDDVARAIERTYTPGGKWIATENTAAQIIADAIRTQGGVR